MRTSNKEVIIKRIYGDKNQEIGYEEVAEVVRCKDCVKRHDGCPMQVWCGTDDDDYCSYGERKDNE